MIVNFRINDGEIDSNEIYETNLPVSKARQLLNDAIILLNNAYELFEENLDEYDLSSETKKLLIGNNKLEELSNMRDDGWVTDTAIEMINFVYNDECFKLYEDIINYTYTE